ncbi:hypothetical protein L3X38_022200 [Prunus dulcis]|uniref:Berberine/berberine-like domain-containing protein n=1 Tax=Prunus dulcis TaxID=3755 RepID=A0AAD4VYA2_PRUDU|nr:hypothetical protein L3X38_022200 [Prunus dulcis]
MSLMLGLLMSMAEFSAESPWEKNSYGLSEEDEARSLQSFWPYKKYLVTWDDDKETEKHISWMRRVYAYMASNVSKSPRAAYLNYRDLDLGRNHDANTSYALASIWGLKYFKSNFRRLVHVKTLVGPDAEYSGLYNGNCRILDALIALLGCA